MSGQAAADDGELAARLAAHVSATREAFARVFDAIASSRQGQPYLDFKMAALGAHGPLSSFTAAFAAALKYGWHLHLIERAIEAQLLSPAAVPLVAQRGAARVVRPEGYDATTMGFLRPETFSAGLLTGMRRLCRVDAGAVCGSGYLVGPQAVMTNFHVIKHLIDTTGQQQSGSAAQIGCLFDFFGSSRGRRVAVADDWLLWSSPDVAADGAAPLDCAVLRLAVAPGRARGWYSLKKAAAAPCGPQQGLFVLQHPAGMNQRVGMACDARIDGSVIRHRAPTAPGSSGGLCLDGDGALVGLHRSAEYAGLELEFNIAVSARAIADALPQTLDLERGHDEPVWRLSSCRSPVLGREGTCQLLLRMCGDGGRRLLVVRGRRHSGKSFTRGLIEEYLHPVAPWLVTYDASELPRDARDLAEQILRAAGVDESQLAQLPQPQRADTTDRAWIRDTLFKWFRILLCEAAESRDPEFGRVLWLVVDLPHDQDLPETGGREFLYTLCWQVMQTRMLRVVLLGLRGPLPAGDRQNETEEEILPDPLRLKIAAIEHYVGCLFAEAGISASRDEIARFSRLAWNVAREDDKPVLPVLSRFLKGPLQAMLQQSGADHDE